MIKIRKYKKTIPVYDITVEKCHNFYANNILIHNCAEVVHPLKCAQKWNDENSLIGVCILSSINPYNIADDNQLEILLRKQQHNTRYIGTQHFPYTNFLGALFW